MRPNPMCMRSVEKLYPIGKILIQLPRRVYLFWRPHSVIFLTFRMLVLPEFPQNYLLDFLATAPGKYRPELRTPTCFCLIKQLPSRILRQLRGPNHRPGPRLHRSLTQLQC